MDARPTAHRRRGRARATTKAQILPIGDADLGDVVEFLHTHHNDHVPWSAACSPPWETRGPNHGFMLRDETRVVGTVLAVYSQRVIDDRVERFCNMGSWCVLPSHRSQSLALLKTLLAQENYTFTSLSPNRGPQEILTWLKFRSLDTSAALIPNLPWLTLPRRTRVLTGQQEIEDALDGQDRQIFRDHSGALAARHVVVQHDDRSCYVLYRVFRHRGVRVFGSVLYASEPDVFRRGWAALSRHLLVRHGLTSTLVERRLVPDLPRLSFDLVNWPKMFLSNSLGPDHVDYLYSELTCVPW
jgi:hypothetical protein